VCLNSAAPSAHGGGALRPATDRPCRSPPVAQAKRSGCRPSDLEPAIPPLSAVVRRDFTRMPAWRFTVRLQPVN